MSINSLPYNPTIYKQNTSSGNILLDTQSKEYSIGSFDAFENNFTVNGLVANKPVLVQTTYKIPDGILANATCPFFLNINGSTVNTQSIFCYSGVNNLYINFNATFTPSTDGTYTIQPLLQSTGTFFSSITHAALQTISVFQ